MPGTMHSAERAKMNKSSLPWSCSQRSMETHANPLQIHGEQGPQQPRAAGAGEAGKQWRGIPPRKGERELRKEEPKAPKEEKEQEGAYEPGKKVLLHPANLFRPLPRAGPGALGPVSTRRGRAPSSGRRPRSPQEPRCSGGAGRRIQQRRRRRGGLLRSAQLSPGRGEGTGLERLGGGDLLYQAG